MKTSLSYKTFLPVAFLLLIGCAPTIVKETQRLSHFDNQMMTDTEANTESIPTSVMLRLNGKVSGTILKSDRDNHWLITAGDDKSVVVWSLLSGQQVTVLRPPIGYGQVGRVDQATISPDGDMVAMSWRDDYKAFIYLFDRSTGQIIRKIEGIKNLITEITFSPNGRALAVSTAEGYVQVFNPVNGQQIGIDGPYGDDATSVNFSPDSREFVTASLDGGLRLYNFSANGLQLLKVINASHILNVRDSYPPKYVRYSPDGRFIAVNHTVFPNIFIYDAKNLALVASTFTFFEGNFDNFVWSTDSKSIYATGIWGTNDFRIRQFVSCEKPSLPLFNATCDNIDIRLNNSNNSNSSSFLTSLFPIIHSSSLNVFPLQTGAIVVANEGGDWGLYREGKMSWVHTSNGQRYSQYELKPNRKSLLNLSSDATVVGFHSDTEKQPIQFNLKTRRFENFPSKTFEPQTSGENISLDLSSNKIGNEHFAILNGRSLLLQPREYPTSSVVSSDGHYFAIGTIFSLRFYSQNGQLLWSKPGEVYAVNVSKDNRYVVTDFEDGTIHWFRLKDGVEVLGFYPHPDGKRWVMWTPSGYFDASLGGEDLIGWHINHGMDKAGDFYPASRFHDEFYRPDIISKVLVNGDEEEAVRLANAEYGRGNNTVNNIVNALPPQVKVISPTDGGAFDKNEIQIKVAIQSPNDAPLQEIKVRVNGKPTEISATLTNRNLNIVSNANEVVRELRFSVPNENLDVQVFAKNKNGVSVPGETHLFWAGIKPADKVVKHNLYVLAVGVSKYANPEYRLELAAKDASDFASSMEQQQSKSLYQNVRIKLLTNENATHDKILSGLDWLKTHVGSNDVGMVFISGHGLNDLQGNYYFLPVNIDLNRLDSTGIVFSEIREALSSLKGEKTILLLDTCHAGNVLGSSNNLSGEINKLASSENGVFVFTSSTGSQTSKENPAWGNGAFSKAILEGMSGKADYNKTGFVTLAGLDYYVTHRVEELTHQQQTPLLLIPGGVLAEFKISVNP